MYVNILTHVISFDEAQSIAASGIYQHIVHVIIPGIYISIFLGLGLHCVQVFDITLLYPSWYCYDIQDHLLEMHIKVPYKGDRALT